MSAKALTRSLSTPLIHDRQAASSSIGSLDSLVRGQSGIVHSAPPVDLLPALGIRPGKRLHLLAKSIAGGPILVCVDRRTIAIDRAIASQIAMSLDG